MKNNRKLINSRVNPNDEFYTRLVDIEKELNHEVYKGKFAGKTVYLPADAEWSNFWVYFRDNFHTLGLKRLYATSLENVLLDYDGVDIKKFPLVFGGDFRSYDCLEILKEADIVVTNPPFSLWREFISLLLDLNKQFLVIGLNIAPLYKCFFNYIKSNDISISSNTVQDFGIKKVACWWYTNIIRYDKPFIKLTESYNAGKYPKYGNYDAINIDKTKDIPIHYDGLMGVPLSFLIKYEPKQFDLIGLASGELGKSIGVGCIPKELHGKDFRDGKVFYYKNGIPTIPFTRVIIKHK